MTIDKISEKQYLSMTEEEKRIFYIQIKKNSSQKTVKEDIFYKTAERKRGTCSAVFHQHQTQGRLMFIEELQQLNTTKSRFYYLCICDCGKWHICRSDAFFSSTANGGCWSCGCLNKETYEKILNDKLVIEKRNNSIRDNLNQKGLIPKPGDIVCGWKIIDSSMQLFGTETKPRRAVKAICPYCHKTSDWIRYDHLSSQKIISRGCRASYFSKRVEDILEILKQNNKEVRTEVSFESCRFPVSGRLARFDFYVDNKYLIEYDGEHHFKVNAFQHDEEDFQDIQKKDEYKNQWCLNNNIPLIRIPYFIENITLEDLELETSKYILQRKEEELIEQ